MWRRWWVIIRPHPETPQQNLSTSYLFFIYHHAYVCCCCYRRRQTDDDDDNDGDEKPNIIKYFQTSVHHSKYMVGLKNSRPTGDMMMRDKPNTHIINITSDLITPHFFLRYILDTILLELLCIERFLIPLTKSTPYR